MPGYLLHRGAKVLCLHAGQAEPVETSLRVKVGGQPIVVQSATYTISACALPPPPNGNGPCVTARWITASTRVRSGGVPVLLQDSQAMCAPSGTGLQIVKTQTRARAT